jgi:hypothetical protein
MDASELNKFINEAVVSEVRKILLEETSDKGIYHIYCDGQPVETFETEEEANADLEVYKKQYPKKEFTIEKGVYDSEDDMLETLDSLSDELEEVDNKIMEPKRVKVGSMAEAILDAKTKGLKKFKLGDKEVDVEAEWKTLEEEEGFGDVELEEGDDCQTCNGEQGESCDECGQEVCECGVVKETRNGKRILRLKESDFLNMVKTMVNESVPGLNVTANAQKESKKHNDDNTKDVEKKLKDYLSFDGNDNPEFPNQIKSGGKKARKNTEEQDEFVADNRGKGVEEADYDLEPSKKFKERAKNALSGDTTMGNSQDAANVVKSKTGENLLKKAERKGKEKGKTPMYNKDVQPVKIVKESKNAKVSVLEEELKRIKNLANYDKKTQ